MVFIRASISKLLRNKINCRFAVMHCYKKMSINNHLLITMCVLLGYVNGGKNNVLSSEKSFIII